MTSFQTKIRLWCTYLETIDNQTKFLSRMVCGQNFVVEASSLYGLFIGIDRLTAICFPHAYKSSKPRHYRLFLAYLPLTLEMAIFGASFLDQFGTEPIPVCLIRAATGKYTSLYGSVYFSLINTAPIALYIVTYCIMIFR